MKKTTPKLRKIRLLFSVINTGLMCLVFIDIYGKISPGFKGAVTYMQLIPSILSLSLGLLAFGCIIDLLLAFLLGRIYCSFLCPLGTLQDFVIYLNRKIKRRKVHYSYTKPFTKTRLGFLLLAFLALIVPGTSFLMLLDPYSNFGRMMSSLEIPILWCNNLIARILEGRNVFFLYRIENSDAGTAVPVFAFLVFAVVLVMSWKFGRLFCNTLCPAGTMLGYISKYSIFKLKIDPEKCSGCMKCSFNCKSECINSQDLLLDFSRCVGCYNCVAVCPSGAIGFETRYRTRKPSDDLNQSRRGFLMSASAGLVAMASPVSLLPGHRPATPPGSRGLDHFNSYCTACRLCVRSCPTGVLQSTFSEYGLSSMFQPGMDYSSGYCNYECNLCGEVCPTGAILSVSKSEKKLIQIGKAFYIKENCIVFREGTDCGACSEHCPTQAVSMRMQGGLNLPFVQGSYCIGCGACENVCPAEPEKAIKIHALKFHGKALRPYDVPPTNKAEEERFPF